MVLIFNVSGALTGGGWCVCVLGGGVFVIVFVCVLVFVLIFSYHIKRITVYILYIYRGYQS